LVHEFAKHDIEVFVAPNLAEATATADIVSTATMARAPILKGEWVRPGTHVDLIGAFKADMREADDTLISMGSLFVDSRDTTIDHIGELKIPIAQGLITADAVKGDLYELVNGIHPSRQSAQDVTVFKNGGGAHLDLMIAGFLVSRL
jgi:ornithine cyclodeaminase